MPSPGKLILVRHTESEWNALGKWTGRADVHLTEKGRQEAADLGKALRGAGIDHAYSSEQARTVETLAILLEHAALTGIPREASPSLNGRSYGDYTGLDKNDVKERLGQDVFTRIRRSWDEPIPNGETLKTVYGRVVPFYMEHILPKILAGKNVLVVSHGNTLRALIKYVEHISDEDISGVEMPFGLVLLYRVGEDRRSYAKESFRMDGARPQP